MWSTLALASGAEGSDRRSPGTKAPTEYLESSMRSQMPGAAIRTPGKHGQRSHWLSSSAIGKGSGLPQPHLDPPGEAESEPTLQIVNGPRARTKRKTRFTPGPLGIVFGVPPLWPCLLRRERAH